MKELIAEVTIKEYIRNVVTSNARKETYYKRGEKIPKKWTGSQFIFIKPKNRKYEVLCDVSEGMDNIKPIVKNPRVAGQPKYKMINMQDLHTLTMQDYERSKIIRAIKAQMIPEVSKLEPINIYPLIIECDIYDTVTDSFIPSDQDWDIDNRVGFYNKVFQDVLCGCPYRDEDTGLMVHSSKIIIVDDNRKYITGSPGGLFVPIENTENRKLVYRIYHDKRDVINNSLYYV